MIGQTYEFETELDLQLVGTYRYHAIKVPSEIQSMMQFEKGVKSRFDGLINGVRFSGALMPTGAGSYYVMVNEAIRKQLKLELGRIVQVSLTIVDPNYVLIPADVEVELSKDEQIRFKWDVLTAGMKRGILHQIETAKTANTRMSRIENLIERLRQSQPFEPFSMRDRL